MIIIFLKLKDVDTPDRKLPIRVKLQRLDLVGATILISGVCCLLLALQWGGNTLPWKSSRVIGLIVGSGLLIILFFLYQWRLGENSTMPLRILCQRSVACGSGFEFLVNMSNYAVEILRICYALAYTC